MLESLHVKNLALIDEQEVVFSPGMNILTGETGAGKSIIIGSVNLALGAKAGKDYIRTGAEYALVELVFSLNEQQCGKIREMDLPLEEDNTLILQRRITAGRSICRANGESISAGQLKNLAGCLLDMYGQHEHQSLLRVSRHRELLDGYAGSRMEEKKNRRRKPTVFLITLRYSPEGTEGFFPYRRLILWNNFQPASKPAPHPCSGRFLLLQWRLRRICGISGVLRPNLPR